MVSFAYAYKPIFEQHELFATGTTGLRIMEATGLVITRYQSGPLGGDQEIGAMIAKERFRYGDFLPRSINSTAA